MKYITLLFCFIISLSVKSQSADCISKFDRAVKVINGFNNCSQKQEVQNAFNIDLVYVINNCPSYYAQNQDKVNQAKAKAEKIALSLNCNNSNSSKQNSSSTCSTSNQTIQQPNSVISQFKEKPIEYSNNKTKDGTKLKDEEKKLLENIESATNIGEFDESKINEILDIKEDCDDFVSYSEIVFKHDNYDISLSYSVLNKTKVTLNNIIYDQYEVKYKFTNKSGNYIHNPQICRINFPYTIKHPTSNSEMDFTENGEFFSYIEYTDGTQLPEDLNSQREDNKYGNIVTRRIIKKGLTSECTKYILVNKCEKLGKPSYTVEFNNNYPIVVQGTDQLIETWINRQAKGISLNNVTSWPIISRSLHEGYTHCNDAKPLLK